MRSILAIAASAGRAGAAAALPVCAAPVTHALGARWRGVAASSTMAGSAAPPVPPQSLSLASLTPAPGSNKQRRRKGRGEGSGMGKYSTRGMKGAKSRAGGGVRLGFEGGQSPLWRRTPKMGYMPAMLSTPFEEINLDVLQAAVAAGRLRSGIDTPITMRDLVEAGVLRRVRHGVKVLGRGAEAFTAPVALEVSAASASAIAAIEKAGGSVVAVYHTPLSLRAHLQPHKFDAAIKVPRPPPRKMRHYLSDDKRGYLSSKVQLAAIDRALGAGVAPAVAAQVVPVYAGGNVAGIVRAGLAVPGAKETLLATNESARGAAAAPSSPPSTVKPLL